MNDLIPKIEHELIKKFQPDHLSIIDDTSKHTHHKGYQKEKSTLPFKLGEGLIAIKIEKHRKIYDAITEFTPYLHAIAIKFIQ